MRSVATIISNRRKQLGITQPEFCERLRLRGIDVRPTAVSSWENGVTQPSVSTFFVICEVLEITDLSTEIWGPREDDLFSALNETGRDRVQEYVRMLANTPEFTVRKEQTPVAISSKIFIYDTPVSAGLGNILEDSSYTEVERTDSVPASATYGVRISGDSMMPRFTDAQTVWVKQQNLLESGDIGIFFYDGQVYCKKFRQTKKGTALVSLNTKYDPIKISDENTFKILGKVVS